MQQGSKAAMAPQRAGRAVKQFCDEAGISDALFYKLEPHRRPASVKVGNKRIVTESPADWLARMGAEAAATEAQE